MTYDKVRQLLDCPLCGRSKLRGVLLCWFCHHKSASNSPFAKATMALLDAKERELSPELATSEHAKNTILNRRSHKPRGDN